MKRSTMKLPRKMKMEYIDDFKILLDLFMRLVDSKAGNPIPAGHKWQNDAQILSLKLFRHLVSMKVILEGVTISKDEKPHSYFIDHSSAKVLARASLETYLVFSYIYSGTPQTTAIFRHRTWNLAGLLDRQRFHPLSDEAKQKLQEEKQRIELLKNQIAGDPEFACHEKKEQKKLLEGDWRAGKSWNRLAESAGFNRNYISQVYSFFCSYSHSSYLSVLQVGQAETIEEQSMLASTSIDVSNSVLGHFILSYCQLFPDVNEVLAKDVQGKTCAELWHYRSKS